MPLVDHALAELGCQEWNAGLLDELQQHAARHRPVRARADHEHRRLRILERLHRLADRFAIGVRTARMAALQRRRIGMFVGDILGQLDMNGAGLFLFGEAEGLADAARDIVRRGHLVRIFGDRPHHRDDVEDLEAALLRLLDRLLAGDHHHRHAAELSVSGRGDEIGRARPQCREAYAGLARMAAIGRGHETRALLVPRQDQLDCLRARQAVEEIQILLARNAENILDAFFLKTFDEQVGCFFHMPVAPSAAHRTDAASNHAGDLQHICRYSGSRHRSRVPAVSGRICNEGKRGCHPPLSCRADASRCRTDPRAARPSCPPIARRP